MPVLNSTAYNTADEVLLRVRTILNDSEVLDGDVITWDWPSAADLLNAGFERVQSELSSWGDETFNVETWLVGLPTMPTVDPEARMIIDDTGLKIFYPSGVGTTFSNAFFLPDNLVLPLKLWERQTGTTNVPNPMTQPNAGLTPGNQQRFFMDWEWATDGLRFRGALQSQDLKILYRKRLEKIAAKTDPLPIRGVLNAAAYQSAKIFADSRGAAIAPEVKATAAGEIFTIVQDLVRRRQRKQVRRQPYSGRGTRQRYI